MLSYEEFQKRRQTGKSIEQIAAESFSRVKTGANQPQTSSIPGGTAMLSYEEFQKQRQAGKSIEQIVDESFSRVKTGTNQPQTSLKQSRTTPYGRKTSAAANTSSPSPETKGQGQSALDKWLRGDAQYAALMPDALTSLAVQQNLEEKQRNRQTSLKQGGTATAPEKTWQESALDKWLRGDAQYAALTPDAITSLAVAQPKEKSRVDPAAALTDAAASSENPAWRTALSPLTALMEQAEGLNTVSVGSALGGSEQKTDWAKVVEGVNNQGLGRIAKTSSSALDFLFGGFLQELQTLAGVTLQGLGAEKAGSFLIENDNPITALNKGVSSDLAAMQEYYAPNVQGNKAAEFVNEYGTSLIAGLPTLLQLIYTGGTSAAPQFTTKILQAISSAQGLEGIAQVANTIYQASAALAKNPRAWMSFFQTVGPNYEAALADGATEDEAATHALINSGFSAAVDASGGLQTLPGNAAEALAKGPLAAGLAYGKSIFEEIGEGLIQGMFGRWLKTTYGKDTKVYSNDPEQNAILKPDEMLKEAVGDALVSAIYGAPFAISQMNTAHKTRGKTTAEPAAVTETAMSAADGGTQGTRAISETAPVETGAKRTGTNPAGEMEAANKGRPVPGENNQPQSAEGQQTAAQAESAPPNNASRNKESTAINTDPEQQNSLPNSPERGKVNVKNPRIERAVALAEQGVSPSEIFNQTGLVVMANGNITDGFGGEIIWRKDYGQTSVLDKDIAGSQERREAEAAISGDDGRGNAGGLLPESGRRAYEALTEQQRERVKKIIISQLEQVGSNEVQYLADMFGDDNELAQQIYNDYASGDVPLEQWTGFFGDVSQLTKKLDGLFAAEQQASLPNSPERGRVKTADQNIPQWWELTEQQQEAITRTIESRVAQLAGKDRAELLNRHTDYELPEQIYSDYTHGQDSLNYWSQWFGDATRLAADLENWLEKPAPVKNTLRDIDQIGIISKEDTEANSADGKPVHSDSSETVTVRRVQGGSGTKTSWERIIVNPDGTISIPNKNADLNISIDNGEHSNYFLSTNRGGDAVILEFEIPKWLYEFITENAIPQKGYRLNPFNQGGTAPKVTDITTPGNSYELPAPWIEWIEEYGMNGRVKRP